ncbi:MAG: TIGR00153 family protein [Pseudomonadales bacterium]
MARVSAYISSVFGQSPFSPLQSHAQLCVNASRQLEALLTHSYAGDVQGMESVYEEITRIEHAADDLKHEIRANLPRGFFMPVARGDLLDLLSRQDEMANLARDISGLMVGRKMQYPETIRESMQALVTASIQSTELVQDIVGELDELIEAGFRGAQARRVINMVTEVERVEHQTDELVVGIRAQMMTMEHELPPVQVMFQYRALDMLAGLADAAERVAHRIQLMLA